MIALDDKGKKYSIVKSDNTYTIKKQDIGADVKYIEIADEAFNAKAEDEGYYVVADCQNKGSYLCRFKKHEDYEIELNQNLMPIFGIKKSAGLVMGIAEKLSNSMLVIVGIKNNCYYLKLRFEITDFGAYEDVSFSLIDLGENSDYCTMAAAYREYQLKRGACKALKDRVKTNKYLKYAVESPEIRIRLAWKPAPPKILEQTVDNEPDMHVACTFDRVKDFIGELKKQGVDKAQICLIGWNKSGHDGRYPQIFPVEEKLGGEKKLRELIKYAQENGYQIVCHTNSTDCYNIADTFSKDIVRKNSDGSLCSDAMAWSGGKMYHLCPVKALEYAKKDLPRVAELGFKGIHYIDVMSISSLRECYDKNHLADKKKTYDCFEEIMQLCHEYFGGFSSEGAFDFLAKYLDFALYVTMGSLENDFFDEQIPLYELVYHGIILYNPSTETVNASIKGEKAVEKLKKCGGRPVFYIYSKFLSGSESSNWLGNDDLVIDTDEQLQYSVSKIKQIYDDYKTDCQKQYEFVNSPEDF